MKEMMNEIRFTDTPGRNENDISAISHLLYQELCLFLSVTEILITDVMSDDKWIIKNLSHIPNFIAKIIIIIVIIIFAINFLCATIRFYILLYSKQSLLNVVENIVDILNAH